MSYIIYLGMAVFLTISIGWFNPDPCPHNLGKGTDTALIMRDCEFVQVGGMGRQWMKKETE
jgi:hypothetical protein